MWFLDFSEHDHSLNFFLSFYPLNAVPLICGVNWALHDWELHFFPNPFFFLSFFFFFILWSLHFLAVDADLPNLSRCNSDQLFGFFSLFCGDVSAVSCGLGELLQKKFNKVFFFTAFNWKKPSLMRKQQQIVPRQKALSIHFGEILWTKSWHSGRKY